MFSARNRTANEKRRLGLSIGFVSLATGLACPALAADMSMPYKAPPFAAAQVYSWSGYYIGGQVGYTRGNDQLFEYFTASGAFTGFARANNVNGFVGGGFVGANYQAGNWVFGIEGDLEGGDQKGGWIDTPTGGMGSTKVDIQGSLRGRIGVTYDRVLFYGTGGVALGGVSHTYTNLLTGIVETAAATRAGWTAGGGIELAVSQNWSLRAEYRHTDYGMSRYSSVTSFPGLTGTQHVKLDTVRIGAAYKF